jgi:hypothetical protein
VNLVQETLLESLQAATPRTLLWIAPAPMAAVDVFCQHEPECRVVSVTPEQLPGALSSLERFDYGLVHQTLERMDLDAGSALLARLRDLHCRRFSVTFAATGDDPAWTRERFLSLALSLHRRVDQDGLTTVIYSYDIDTYNPRREWNDPSHWANPENFDRYRW